MCHNVRESLKLSLKLAETGPTQVSGESQESNPSVGSK